MNEACIGRKEEGEKEKETGVQVFYSEKMWTAVF